MKIVFSVKNWYYCYYQNCTLLSPITITYYYYVTITITYIFIMYPIFKSNCISLVFNTSIHLKLLVLFDYLLWFAWKWFVFLANNQRRSLMCFHRISSILYRFFKGKSFKNVAIIAFPSRQPTDKNAHLNSFSALI